MLDALDFEDRIHQAYTESLEKQTVLPLIKQELQCKIQCNRLSRGEPELVLEDESPKVYELTEEEKYKRDVRLEQNRQSALRSRRRSKEKEKALKQKMDQLCQKNRLYKKEIKELKKEKKIALAKLKAHVCVCGNKTKREELKFELMLH